jgi:hypothetical protein
MFLGRTVQDILEHIEDDTEVIVGLDGVKDNSEILNDPRVNVIYSSVSIGQRAMTNLCAKLSRAKYVMKVDAHCSFDQGFDKKLINEMKDNWTMVPTMRNLWAYDWKCYKCGWKKYQGPTPEVCPDCGETKKIRRKMIWIGKLKPQSNSYCFDQDPHFQYFNEYTKREEYKKMLEETGLTESMSLQGSCFMLTREKYWELNICDEAIGSWGSQGIEVACKTWLSGGKVVVNHKTWYAHMFRTQGGDFSFPYDNPGSKVQNAKKVVRELFYDNKWKGQIYPLSWLIEKFWPVKGWEEDARQKLKDWPLKK